MEKNVMKDCFDGLNIIKSSKQINDLLDRAKNKRTLQKWYDFIKNVDSDYIKEFVSGIDLGNIDYCGSSYRRSLERSLPIIKSWLDSWSSDNPLKNAGDMIELWRNKSGISGVFIVTNNTTDRKTRKINYWFYKFTSTEKEYLLTFMNLYEDVKVFNKEKSTPLSMCSFVKLKYNSLTKVYEQEFNISTTRSKKETTLALLSMILFKKFSTNVKESRKVQNNGEDFIINYHTEAKNIKYVYDV